MLVLTILSDTSGTLVKDPGLTIAVSLIWFLLFGAAAVYLDYDMRMKRGYRTTTDATIGWIFVGVVGLLALAGLVNAFWPVIMTAYSVS